MTCAALSQEELLLSSLELASVGFLSHHPQHPVGLLLSHGKKEKKKTHVLMCEIPGRNLWWLRKQMCLESPLCSDAALGDHSLLFCSRRD